MKPSRRGHHLSSAHPWKLSHIVGVVGCLLFIVYTLWLLPLVLKSSQNLPSPRRQPTTTSPTTSIESTPLDVSIPVSTPDRSEKKLEPMNTVHTSSIDAGPRLALEDEHAHGGQRTHKQRYIRESNRMGSTDSPSVPHSSKHDQTSELVSEAQPLIGRYIENKNPFPPSLTYTSKGGASATESAVLVVCGTDGSGTRRVVQVLTQLGVSMVSEDPETYDIHADSVKGWPEVVRPVISFTRSLVYDPTDLPEPLQSDTRSRVQRILRQLELDSTKPTSYRLAVGGVLQRNQQATATKVKYGFKAPVAMTLGPWWADGLPHLKIVHVVRDGRDISFSANQGPVVKFYSAMYPTASGKGLPDAVKSIKLWSDWNTQLHSWAQKYSKIVQNSNSDSSFGYFVMHAEDLVHHNPVVRFAAMQRLSEFVGSTISMEELCCMSQRSTDFMGSHDRAKVKKQQAEAQLASRYGKWKSKLAHNSALSASIHHNGADGLKLFGYEPPRRMADRGMTSDTGYQCLVSIEEGSDAEGSDVKYNTNPRCLVGEEQALKATTAEYAVTGICDAVFGVDFKAGDIEAIGVTPGSKSSCCRKCQRTEGCRHFTVDPDAQMCYLKSASIQGSVPNNKLISGSLL